MSYGGRVEALFYCPSGVTVSATSAAGGTDSVSLTSAWYTPTSFAAHLQTRLNAVNTNAWTVSLSTGASGTGLVTLNCSSTPYALTWTTAEVGTVLGFAGNISSTSSASTGTTNARGLWLPKCPLQIDGHPSSAPKATDARSTSSGTGRPYSMVSSTKYRHRGLRWTHLHSARVYRVDETTTHASLEQWLDDTQYAAGHSWFRPGSAFQIYWSNNGTDSIVGSVLNSGAGPTDGWVAVPAISSFEPRMVSQGLLSYWSFEIPAIEAEP